MATCNWIGGTGAQAWTTAANWDTGTVPATGDTAVINYGSSAITTGLAQSAVTLAALTWGPNFTGSAGGATGAFPSPLQIGCSGNAVFNSQSSQIVVDFGTMTPAIVVLNTGSPSSSTAGAESLRIRGGGAGTTISVTGSNSVVGIATDYDGLTATMDWSIDSGILNVGKGVTWTNGVQSGTGGGSGGTVTTYGGGTSITQSGTATLTTYGTAAIATLTITSQATLNHRPVITTDAFGTLNIGPNASVDVSQDPRPIRITNPIIMATGSTLTAFNPVQIQVHGGGAFSVKTQQCSISDVTLNVGAPVLATITNY